MNHTLCITKVFNDTIMLYKKNWKACLAIGALVGAFWLAENKLSSKISYVTAFCKYELPQSKTSVDMYTNFVNTLQYHMTFPYSYQEYIIFGVLLLILMYLQLCISKFFMLLFSKKTPRWSDAIVSVGTFARATAAYLFIVLMCIVFLAMGVVLLRVGDWFLLSLDHKIVLLAIYCLSIVVPFLLSFTLIRWSAVDGSPTVSQIIDNCFANTRGNKLRIVVIFILMHLVSYICQFCFLRILYWPLMQLNIFPYGVFVAIALVTPLKELAWTSVYQQIK